MTHPSNIQLPATIGKVDVQPYLHPENPFEANGNEWVILIPCDHRDRRLWHFCVDDGRIVELR